MAPALRIVSFLPSATEMACALGLAEQLVGVTHECDYPQEVKGKPIVVRSVLPVGKHERARDRQEETIADAQGLSAYPNWKDIPAVRSGRVYAVNANAYFARPGPRVVDGTALLAHLIHPDLFEWTGATRAFERVEYSEASETVCSLRVL